MSATNSPRVLITGAGVVSPSGWTLDDHWDSVLNQRNHISSVTRFDPSNYPVQLGAQVSDELDIPSRLSGRMRKQTDLSTQFALIASDDAIASSQIPTDPEGEYDIGVATASTGGAVEFGQRELEKLWSKGKEHVSAYQSYAWFYAVNSGQISIRHKLKGPSCVLVADHAGGLDVFVRSESMIREGQCRAALVGGVDGPICPWAWSPNIVSGILSERKDPVRAYAPFRTSSSGAVLGEGGAILVLEREGSRPEGEPDNVLAAFAGGASGFAPTDEAKTSGLALATTIHRALRKANVDAAEVDIVFADAQATSAGDTSEANAYRSVFGERKVPITAPKAGFGRLLAGAGAVDLLTAAQSLQRQVAPGTPGGEGELLPHVNLLRESIDVPLRTALVVSRGVNGFCSAAVLQSA